MWWKPSRLNERPTVPWQGIPGCVYLFEAIDLLGESMFGTEWDWRELLARPLDKIGDDFAGLHGAKIPSPDGTEIILLPPPWYLDNPDGRQLSYLNLENALAASLQFALEAKARADVERNARKRFENVRDRLLRSLADGHLVGFVYYPHFGKDLALAAEFWRRRNAPHFFDMGDNIYRWENPNEYVAESPPPVGDTVYVSDLPAALINSPLLRQAEAFAEEQRKRNSGNIIIRRGDLQKIIAAQRPDPLASTESAAIRALAEHLRSDPDMTRTKAKELCQPFVIGKNGFQNRVWPKAREKAGLAATARPGAKRRAKSSR